MTSNPDQLYEELSRLNNELVNMQRELSRKNAKLEAAVARIRQLEGLVPICMHCHRIRDDVDIWHRLEKYLGEHADVSFTHSVCPACMEKHYPDPE